MMVKENSLDTFTSVIFYLSDFLSINRQDKFGAFGIFVKETNFNSMMPKLRVQFAIRSLPDC